MKPMVAASRPDWAQKMNDLGSKRIPFLFILDYELQKPIIHTLRELPDFILYKFDKIKNYTSGKSYSKPLTFEKFPICYEKYQSAFEKVKAELQYGNSFLLNLTFATPIETNYTLSELFKISVAKYKLYYDDQFIVSSPETFIRIKDGHIYTYPMKGTINAKISGARDIILHDPKEMAEHHTIVDLLRNDLSHVATNVKVKRFRYIEQINTYHSSLLQVSSEIVGDISTAYPNNLGDIFCALLPAGSISGAPKKKTLEIIKSNEEGKRGYYTGVFGIFDGKNVDSAVMIRYI
ncbi:MAG: aminodeoxychorismate synthase component I, partial [Saprospiraceae bacterium]